MAADLTRSHYNFSRHKHNTLFSGQFWHEHSRHTTRTAAPSIDPSIARVDQFTEVLSGATDWYTLGTLLDVPTTDLDWIKQEYRGMQITRYQIEMYNCLKRLGKLPTWKSIASSLRTMGNHALAERIHSTYIPVDDVDQTINRTPEAMVPPAISRKPECATCIMNEKYIEQLKKQADTLKQDLCIQIETIRLEKGILILFFYT